ncbi:14066_t:CDS:2 [Acaulospora colombiana]|uniref:14066_t:CDS:1 n=1 Tax=Acaulospora colombiana TaxID=27376 RepID=A0ACA9KI06_9GLOM|nr:14066_t:CDS:2 [Acaulospora colombiana]
MPHPVETEEQVSSIPLPVKTKEQVPPAPLKVDDTYVEPPPGVDRNLSVFIGIMTVDKKISMRRHLRKMFAHNNAALARYLGVKKSPVTIRFITGLPRGKYVSKLERESKKHGDIVILNITENMNNGKTLKFLDWFAENRKDDYVVKADDDSFIHLIHYYRDLQDVPRERAYYGMALNFTVPKSDPDVLMWGMGYTISRDLVMDIVNSSWVRSNAVGNEDNMNADPRFPDESIIIHRLKSVEAFKNVENLYFYKDKFPKLWVIRNSTTAGLITKKELFQGCWVMQEKNQTWKQALSWTQAQDIYKNWFYEAWGFKEGRWYGHYGPVDKMS